MTKKFVIDGNFTLEIYASTTVTNRFQAYERAQALLDLAQKEGLLTTWVMREAEEGQKA